MMQTIQRLPRPDGWEGHESQITRPGVSSSSRCLLNYKPAVKRADFLTLSIGSALRHPNPVPRDPEDGVLLEAQTEITGSLEVHLDRPPGFSMVRIGIVTREAAHPGAGRAKFAFEFEVRRSVLLPGPGLTGRRVGGDDGEFVRVTAVRPGAAEADIEIGGMEAGVFHAR
jgi:hypothetical protein